MKWLMLVVLSLTSWAAEDLHWLRGFNPMTAEFDTDAGGSSKRQTWQASPATSDNMIAWLVDDRMIVADNREQCSGQWPWWVLDLRANQAVCAREVK